MKLYHHPLSGHAHRARLFVSLLGLNAELVEVDLLAGEHKQPAFLALNPLGQVPVLVDDDGTAISDSNAILVYLARKYDRTDWMPEDPASLAAVQRWLSVAAGELAFGPAAARLVTVFGSRHNPQEVITRAHGLLANLERHLDHRDWLVGTAPTIADVSLYSYLSSAPEGNVDLAPYPNVRALLGRVEHLAGFVPFVQTAAGLRVIA